MADFKQILINKGVHIPNPAGIEIADDINPDRIDGNGVVLHTGCRLRGRDTFIMQGTVIGEEGPVTIDNCAVGPAVRLKGGFFQQAVFLKQAAAGLGSHVRAGTIFEEQAGIAHNVGLKQTILFPFVTLGSIINFCDCLMAGGTSRKNHSEVGSAYIHFNFTPNHDKATPSIMGDVPNGVMLDQAPIFLGGQGGLIGPCRLAYGTVVAAGTIYRKDQPTPDRLVFEGVAKSGSLPHQPGLYRSIKRTVHNNLIYIGNLAALLTWYRRVRPLFASPDLPETLINSLEKALLDVIEERLRRLEGLARNMPASIELHCRLLKRDPSARLLRQQAELHRNWAAVKRQLRQDIGSDGNAPQMDTFLSGVQQGVEQNGRDYIHGIQSLEGNVKDAGRRWLQGIVDGVVGGALAHLPSLGDNKGKE